MIEKFVCLLALAAALAQGKTDDAKRVQQQLKYFDECKKEVNLSEPNENQIKHLRISKGNDEVNRFYLCFYQKNGLMQDGKVAEQCKKESENFRVHGHPDFSNRMKACCELAGKKEGAEAAGLLAVCNVRVIKEISRRFSTQEKNTQLDECRKQLNVSQDLQNQFNRLDFPEGNEKAKEFALCFYNMTAIMENGKVTQKCEKSMDGSHRGDDPAFVKTVKECCEKARTAPDGVESAAVLASCTMSLIKVRLDNQERNFRKINYLQECKKEIKMSRELADDLKKNGFPSGSDEANKFATCLYEKMGYMRNGKITEMCGKDSDEMATLGYTEVAKMMRKCCEDAETKTGEESAGILAVCSEAVHKYLKEQQQKEKNV